ncbi:MAG: sugar transferase [Candidatus Kerfeldbacteria bacterium]|nr:sugar transferase [Candidatus Kerfeldbacteria bacterium]
MKKAELIFGAILVPIDYLMLTAAGLTAYFLRFKSPVTDFQPVLYEIPFRQYLAMASIVALVWLVIFAFSGLYRIRGTRRLIEEARKIFLACSTGVLAIIILFFFQRDLFSSRFIILAAYVCAVVYVTIARFVVIYIERALFRRGIGVHHVVLIGHTRLANIIASEMRHKPTLGLQVVEQFDAFTDTTKKRILSLIEQGQLDELIQTNPNTTNEKNEEISEFCDDHHLVFKYAAALFDTQSVNMAIQPIAGIPIVEIQKTPLDGWGRIVKRTFDIVGSLLLIILTSPVMLITSLLIYLESGRPIFYSRENDEKNGKRSERIGQYGKPFFYFKFRSMQQGKHRMRYTELQDKDIRKGSPLVKIIDDPRITRVGKCIRKFSIDELPEFFLVFKGEMSLVGPRPHLPEEVAKYKKHHKRVLNMKPGITGLAQISGRSDLDFEDEVRLDTFYMENWALWLDLVILIKTPFVLFKKRRAL